jgi:hypothetical protein
MIIIKIAGYLLAAAFLVRAMIGDTKDPDYWLRCFVTLIMVHQL